MLSISVIRRITIPKYTVMTSHTEKLSSFLPDSVTKGFTDGENYDSHRPDYTDEATDEVIRMLNLSPNIDKTSKHTVVELGAGTGKFTRNLANKLQTRNDITFLATEPMSELLSVLKRNNPSQRTMQCATENLPMVSSSVQGVVAAQCFHWFSNKTALDEIHRVLCEAGNIVMLWNFNDRTVDWINQLHNRIDRLRVDPFQYRGNKWKTAIDEHPGFQFVEQKIAKGATIKGNIKTVLDHCSTHSAVQKLESNKKATELDEIRKILTTHPDTKGEDCIELNFLTDIYQYRKIPLK